MRDERLVLEHKDKKTSSFFTCFCAAKITFMKFMYWRAQSSAAFITYPAQSKKMSSKSGEDNWETN